MKVSVLSAVFNESQHLPQMIESIQGQSHSDWELILVDDGSTDGTHSIIEGAAVEDPRIINGSTGSKLGKVKAFNRAFELCRGDLVVIVGGDDWLPSDSLVSRVAAFEGRDTTLPLVAFFKIRTVSADQRYDGIVLPKGRAASRSGGSISMTRALARMVFPIPEDLVAEDVWLASAAVDLADGIIDKPSIVLNYRIHEGNSNPRNRPFAEMTQSMHARHRAWLALLHASQFALSSETRQELHNLWAAEELRHAGETFKLLAFARIRLIDRVAMASMSSPFLYGVRTRFYRHLSGLRAR